MALISIPADHHHHRHIKLRKSISFEKKPALMLKDYLLRDDLSSCSSSSFKSFPRQHCCTTVRFLLEAELKKSKDSYSATTKRLLKRSRTKPKPGGAAAVSALQRASEAVLNAVKLLPSPSIKRNSSSWKKGRFTRSFSRKIFRRSFWRKSDHHHKEDDNDNDRGRDDGDQIRRCKLFREFLEEKNQPSDQNAITDVITTDISVSTITAGRASTDTSSNSWGESEFTADVLQSSSGNSESSSENDIVEGKSSLPSMEKVSDIVGVTDGEDSINFTKEQNWPNEEGKEQFSPVSILDCPFNDEEEEDSSPHFKDGLPLVEGTKQKVRRFEKLEPVDLEKRIAITELEEGDDDESSSSLESNNELLKLLKTKIPSEILDFMMDENLLLDFFKETLTVEDEGELLDDIGFEDHFGVKCLKLVEDWINMNSEEFVVGWDMQVYLKEMEKNESWRNFDEEKEDVGLMMEFEVFDSLVDELLNELLF